MTVRHTDDAKQRQQAELQEQLRSVLRNGVRDIQAVLKEAAEVWKKCAEAGCDMSPKHYATDLVPLPFVQLVADIANGKVMLEVGVKLLSTPAGVRKAMASVPPPVQEKFLEHGVEVWRDGQAQRVPISDLLDHEAQSLVDPNSGRALSAEEQAERAAKRKKRPPRTDTELRGLYLTPEQHAELELISHRKATSKNSLVLAAMVKDGLISPRKRTRTTRPAQDKSATSEVGVGGA